MSKASRRTGSGLEDRIERLRPWTAAILTALLHLLLLLLILLAPPITLTPPQDSAGGGRTEVTFIDDTQRPPSPAHKPSAHKAPPRKPRKVAPAAERVQTTLVTQPAEPEPASAPPDVPDAAVEQPARVWGQPPGMLPQNVAATDAGPTPAVNRGRSNEGASAGTSMEVGGYQVYYDLLDETRLRAWRDQGMTELFLPLPGTRRYMVCPLEVALRRDSGACRLVEPDSPELKAIGDARKVIIMQRVYKLGEALWSGPGPYR